MFAKQPCAKVEFLCKSLVWVLKPFNNVNALYNW